MNKFKRVTEKEFDGYYAAGPQVVRKFLAAAYAEIDKLSDALEEIQRVKVIDSRLEAITEIARIAGRALKEIRKIE